MDFGTITAIEIAVNLDTGENVRLATVQAVGDDKVTVELPMSEGVEFCPSVGDIVYYDEVDAGYLAGRYIQSQLPVEGALTDGDQEIYARKVSGSTYERAAKVRLKSDGTLVFNDGTDFGVRFNALESALSQLVSDMNEFFKFSVSHAHNVVALGYPTTGTTSDVSALPFPAPKPAGSTVSLDMSNAKAEEVKL